VNGTKDKSNQATIAMKIPRTVLSIEARREYCAKERFHSEEIRFEPDFCEDPILALENFKASSYDLIRLDIKMPEMDQETLAINKESQTPSLNVFFNISGVICLNHLFLPLRVVEFI
jgi:CheY-like chemotaxis protein